MKIGDTLKKLRENSGISQKKLGELLGISERTIKSYETSQNTPPVQNLVKIANFFGVSTDYLLGLTSKHTNDILMVPNDEEDLIFSMFEMYQNLTPDKRICLNEIVKEILNQVGYEKKTLTDKQQQLIEKCENLEKEQQQVEAEKNNNSNQLK